MKYKVGDKVRIKSLDWYNENKDSKYEFVDCGNGIGFYKHMTEYCGKVMTISQVWNYSYEMENHVSNWNDEMIEGLVEEPIILNGKEVLLKLADIELPSGTTKIWECPEGYVFKDENGNVINTTKIVLEKKKKEYPKTYGECCKILNIAVCDLDILDNMLDTTEIIYRKNLDRLLNSFRKLLICRDAYWKIAGEEMGLGKPWEPDWEDGHSEFYVIVVRKINGVLIKEDSECFAYRYILVFPTAEMRDAFKENFDADIEFCKELL